MFKGDVGALRTNAL